MADLPSTRQLRYSFAAPDLTLATIRAKADSPVPSFFTISSRRATAAARASSRQSPSFKMEAAADGVKFSFFDTAGIRDTADKIEAMGVERSKNAVENADLVIFVCDGSKPLTQEDTEVIDICMDKQNAIALINKTDLGQVVSPSDLPFMTVIPVCTKTGEGLDMLADVIDEMFAGETPCDGSVLTNSRQYDAIRRASTAIDTALHSLRLGLTPDAVLIDVEEAMSAIGEVTGATVREDITARIFERFCVGK